MEFESHEDEDEYPWEGRRNAAAVLLKSRGAEHAAALVAVSHYRSDYAGDNRWTGTLSVPPELYDHAVGALNDDIRRAFIDIVGADQFADLIIRIRTPPYESDLAALIVASLGRTWVPSERVGAPSLDS